MDETLPLFVLWKYADSRGPELIKISLLNSALTVLIAIILIVLFYLAWLQSERQGVRVQRYNSTTLRLHAWEKELLWGQDVAPNATNLVKFDGLDSRGRVAKLVLEGSGTSD